MLRAPRKAQLGLNLVELMIGLTVGLVVLAAMSTVYLNSARGSRDTMNANRLNQDLRAVMDLMVSDIRRAGFWGTAAPGAVNPFTVRGNPATDIYVTAGCILYSYDATYNATSTPGTADANVDYFGFRLNGGAVQSATAFNNTNQPCTNNLGWQGLTDPNVINVSALTFTTGRPPVVGTDAGSGSKCLKINPTGSVAWEVESAATQTTSACACTNTLICPSYPTGSPPITGDLMAETRQITISITANYMNPADPNDMSLSRTLTESVLVRNNRIYTVP